MPTPEELAMYQLVPQDALTEAQCKFSTHCFFSIFTTLRNLILYKCSFKIEIKGLGNISF